MNTLIEVSIVGIVATLVTDLWGIARRPLLGIAAPDYGMVGRWIAHMRHGRFIHCAIGKSAPATGERIIGWTAHYLIGIAFAALLVALSTGWLQAPTFAPALIVGLCTVTAPFLIMQPGMGAGLLAWKTPRPNAARLQSVITHAVFGLGLYLGGRTVEIIRSILL
ncbi:MAG TPA: DUF2938 domain-containing protein [Rhodocyclaceae bacterium]|nr:DUF2938 domain-containing protein [Rhodocyclaceae bacterium]